MNQEDEPVYEKLDEDENNVLFRVTTKRWGVKEYWIPKHPIEWPPDDNA